MIVHCLAAVMSLAAMLVAAVSAHAACSPPPNRPLGLIADLVARDPRAALRQTAAALENTRLAPAERSALIALQAEAYGRLTLADAARTRAAEGLRATLPGDTRNRAEFLWLLATNSFEPGALTDLRGTVATELTKHPGASTEALCLHVAMGSIDRMLGTYGEAAQHLMRAYRESSDGTAVHMEAARLLARLMASADNYAHALALNQKVLGFEQANGFTFMLGMAHGFRGIYLNGKGDYRSALRELDIARAAAKRFDDEVGEAYLAIEQCRAHIGLQHWGEARRLCNAASSSLMARQIRDVQEAERLLGQIDLAQGRPLEARQRLDRVIHALADIPSIGRYQAFRLRAEAHRRLGDLGAALADMDRYAETYGRWVEAVRDRKALIAQGRFEAELQIARQKALQRQIRVEADEWRDRARRNALLLLLAGLAIVLLVVMYLMGVRHRRALTIVATRDSLTGLATRRHAMDRLRELAGEGAQPNEPLTIAMIDIDFFKLINDQCGHPTGDRVLRDFAAALQRILTDASLIGRWGGEEFIAIFSGQNEAGILTALEALRRESANILGGNGMVPPFGFSAGLSTPYGAGRTVETMLDEADKALYRAKSGGRNRTVRFSEIA